MSATPVIRRKFGTRSAGATERFKALDGVAATASDGSRTVTLDVRGMARVVFVIEYTRGGAGTAVTLTPSVSLDEGTTYGRLTSTSVAAGAGTVSAYTDTYTSSATGTICVSYDVRGYDYFKVIFAITAGNGSDTLTVYASASAGS